MGRLAPLGRPTVKAGAHYGEWHRPPEYPEGGLVATRGADKVWTVYLYTSSGLVDTRRVEPSHFGGRSQTLRLAGALALEPPMANPKKAALRAAHTAGKRGARTAGKFVPGVGEVLMVLDAAPVALDAARKVRSQNAETRQDIREAKGVRAKVSAGVRGSLRSSLSSYVGSVKTGVAALVGSGALRNPEGEAARAANAAEIDRMLQRMPSDWRKQLRENRELLQGLHLPVARIPPEVPNARTVLEALNLNNQHGVSSEYEAGQHPASGHAVPADVREAAMEGVRQSYKNNYGGYYAIGLARAIQLATSAFITDAVLMRMRMYFDRKTKPDRLSDQYTARHGKRYWSWLNWGGDPGAVWAQSRRFAELVPKANPAVPDVYKQNFETLEELLSMPQAGVRSMPQAGVRSNPSKAYERLVKAVKDSDGWIDKGGEFYYYAVLAGPLTGTYVLGARYNEYIADFVFGFVTNEQTVGLARFNRARIQKRLGPLLAVVQEINQRLGNPLKDRVITVSSAAAIMGKTRDEETEVMQNYWGVLERSMAAGVDPNGPGMAAWDVTAAQLAKKQKKAEKQDAFVRRTQEAEKIRQERSQGTYRAAVALYIMSQAGNTPVDRVIAALREQPKRLYSLTDVALPTRLTDRSRYGAEFLNTWSAQKALKRLFPNVEGHVPAEMYLHGPRLSRVRTLLKGVPSWRQLADDAPVRDEVNLAVADGDELQPPVPVRSAKEQREHQVGQWLGHLVHTSDRLAAVGIKPTVFRDQIMRTYTRGEWDLLADALQAMDGLGNQLAETVEGQQLLRARAQQDWRRIIRAHDHLTRLYQQQVTNRTKEETRAAAEAHKKKAFQLNLIPGVQPLVTKEEYDAEGDALGHCVGQMGYCWKLSTYEFSFTAPSGERATLSLDTQGRVSQFYGPGNSTPAPVLQQMLKQFLEANKDNLKAMADGKFPVKQNPRARWRNLK